MSLLVLWATVGRTLTALFRRSAKCSQDQQTRARQREESSNGNDNGSGEEQQERDPA